MLKMMKAIDHAIDVWKVDIISMSFGFPKPAQNYEVLESAIRRAHQAHILMFAAASNGGANNGRSFPARHQQVICIHSTDANGNRSRFSPTAITADSNFATIGESIESSWPEYLSNPGTNKVSVAHKSGTSFATPIAAGIAAFLLQYARMHLSKDQAKMMKQPLRMKAVLKEIARYPEGHKKRDDYDYIALSQSSDNLFGKSEVLIKETIINALMTSA
jgi:subtilisin family serine protease